LNQIFILTTFVQGIKIFPLPYLHSRIYSSISRKQIEEMLACSSAGMQGSIGESVLLEIAGSS
jgi:hypothetical protein